jgi:hypothetical protein
VFEALALRQRPEIVFAVLARERFEGHQGVGAVVVDRVWARCDWSAHLLGELVEISLRSADFLGVFRVRCFVEDLVESLAE